MSLSMYSAAIPAFLNTLGALDKILDKAAAHCEARKIDPAALLTTRLYPDMFMFTRQVQAHLRLRQEHARPPDRRAAEISRRRKIIRRPEGADRQDRRLRQRLQAGTNRCDPPGRTVTLPDRAAQTMTLKGAQYLTGFRAAEFLFPRHHGLRHPAPLRRRDRQAGFFSAGREHDPE